MKNTYRVFIQDKHKWPPVLVSTHTNLKKAKESQKEAIKNMEYGASYIEKS